MSATQRSPHASASMLQMHHCNLCGWPVILCNCVDGMSVYAEADFHTWLYCANKSCANHSGEIARTSPFNTTLPDWVKKDLRR